MLINRKKNLLTPFPLQVTSMLVSVVLVFLICHSVKLIINCYEVYELLTSGGGHETEDTSPTGSTSVAFDAGDGDVQVMAQNHTILWPRPPIFNDTSWPRDLEYDESYLDQGAYSG